MKRFVKYLAIFSLPWVVLLFVYIWADPFKIIQNYDSYHSDLILLNRGYVSTKVFLKNNKEQDYNSFILGSSRSLAFTSSQWKNYLGESSRPYSYSSWNESIEGIYRKVLFIDSQGNSINNALVIIDTDNTFQSIVSTLDFEHPAISKRTWIAFHTDHIKQLLHTRYMIPGCIDFRLFGKQREYMKGFFGMSADELNPINNDWKPNSENEILADSVSYYSKGREFYERPSIQQYNDEVIFEEELNRLEMIKKIFDKHQTNYKIVIGPLYDQIKMNEKDLRKLQSVFGSENVYDYAGINDITDSKYNYANDVWHFRKRTANRILTEIYNSN